MRGKSHGREIGLWGSHVVDKDVRNDKRHLKEENGSPGVDVRKRKSKKHLVDQND